MWSDLAVSEQWRAAAACRGADPELFFPEGTSGPASRDSARAKLICGTCPVRASCLDWALEHAAAFGIWGGFTQDERRTIGAALAAVRRRSPGRHRRHLGT
jgi:WhiB family transcriptional regulator, redox-sensing transcriptional regulator